MPIQTGPPKFTAELGSAVDTMNVNTHIDTRVAQRSEESYESSQIVVRGPTAAETERDHDARADLTRIILVFVDVIFVVERHSHRSWVQISVAHFLRMAY